MGTTGTIMGVSRFLKEKNPAIQIIGCSRPRARRFRASANGRRPICRKIYDRARVDRIESVSQADAEDMTRRLAARRGNFCGHFLGRWRMRVALRIREPK